MTFCVILVSAVVMIAGVFGWLYNTSRQNLINMWKVNAVQMARDVEYYLTCPTDAVVFASRHVEEMMRAGASNREIQDYLVSETEIYDAIVDSNSTGVYGYCRGEYLDGSGWVPEPDYELTARPWYVQAVAAGGRIAFVKPYMNLQTLTMMMSVSRLLDDGESVVSMDIFLDGVQALAQQTQSSDQVDVVLVMDNSGFIVAHSDADEIGKSYMADGSAWDRMLASRVLAGEQVTFSMDGLTGSQMVFSKRINSEWTSVLIVNESRMLGSIQYIFSCSAAALMVVIATLTGIFLVVSRKYRETERLDREVHAASEIYDAMYLIDMAADTLRPLRADPVLERCLGGDYAGCRAKLIGAAAHMATEGSVRVVESFMDLSTIEERVRSLRSISQEYLDRSKRWMRMRFVVVSRDEAGMLRELLWAQESIDEDRRRQEHLRRLAETDAMTNTRNRRSGEALVRQMMDDGVGGMFALLDVDQFKSINDMYGHVVGDRVLVAVAAAFRDSMRQDDVVFRLGGDEFAAYAPGLLAEATARRVMDALLRGVSEIRIDGMEGRDVRVSIGVTFFTADREDTFEALYRRADAGMYESKQRGGNRATYVE